MTAFVPFFLRVWEYVCLGKVLQKYWIHLQQQQMHGKTAFNEWTAYQLIVNTNIKHWFWIYLFLELIYKRSHRQFATGKMNFTILLISFSGICKQWLIVTQLLQTFNDVKAVMWLVIKAHVIQVHHYTFTDGRFADLGIYNCLGLQSHKKGILL